MITSILALLAFATAVQAEPNPDLSPACDTQRYSSKRVLNREDKNTANDFLTDAKAYSETKKEIYEAIYQCVQSTAFYKNACKAALEKHWSDRNLNVQMNKAGEAAALNCRTRLEREDSDLRRNSSNLLTTLYRAEKIPGFTDPATVAQCQKDVGVFVDEMDKAVRQKSLDLENVARDCLPKAQ